MTKGYNTVHRQSDYAVRFDWGLSGALAVTDGCDVAIVVDVLSFTTTLSVALDRGTTVWPYPWRDGAADYAAERNAVAAQGRSRGGLSLSPASIRAAPELDRLVLPSPNGSSICFALADKGITVAAAALRNAAAVGQWAAGQGRVAVIAAGERWPDGSLRPAVEDLAGAAAVLAHLDRAAMSPEALAALDVSVDLHACAGGRELIAIGFGTDVDIAAERDTSRVIPVLRDGRFDSQVVTPG